MRKAVYILSSILLMTLNAHAIYFKHLGIKDGLSQLSVMSIYQDCLGGMWFGTQEGLNLYDGNEITVFKGNQQHDNSPDDVVLGNDNRNIVGNGKGSLYFISDGQLISYSIVHNLFSLITPQWTSCLLFHEDLLYYVHQDTLFTYHPESGNKDFFSKLNIPNETIQSLHIDTKGVCWIGTHTNLYKMDRNKKVELYLSDKNISKIFEDSRKNIWIATYADGVYMISASGDIIQFASDTKAVNHLSHDQVRCFAEDEYGNIWIGTFNGLNRYNPETKQFIVYKQDIFDGSLKHSSVFSLFKDQQGTIWVGTYYGGVHYFNPETDYFTFYGSDANRNDCLNFPFVGHMLEDEQGNIWICTEGGGLNHLNRKRKLFNYYPHIEGVNSIAHDNVKSICINRKHQKLITGTHTGGLSILDLKTNHFTNFSGNTPGYPPQAGNVVNQVALYKEDSIVFLTQTGIYAMNLITGESGLLFKENSQFYGRCFLIDSQNYLWLIRGSSILRINMNDHTDIRQFRINQQGLGHYMIISVFEDNKQRIWLGSLGSGLFRYDENNDYFHSYTEENGLLLSNYCYDIKQTLLGNIIVSGDKGLTLLNIEENISTTVELETALPISGINLGCGLLTCRNGEIFVGGTDGLTSFFEQDLFNIKKEYSLYFNKLYVNNELITPASANSILSKSIAFKPEIQLRHNQNDFNISFASNNYTTLVNHPAYEYRLEGFEDKWIKATDDMITYTNISPGSYILHVREERPDHSISEKGISLKIKVLAPFYATPLFYCLYICILILLAYWYYNFKRSQYILKTSLEYERKEKDRIEQLNNFKLQFFSNISHEFRTPLTLIISQMELLLHGTTLSPTVYNKLLKLYKNTYHLRNLISELLDFRKLEQGHIKLSVREEDIVPFIREIYYSFYEHALSRSITYRFNSNIESVKIWFDTKQLQKVFFNLLSNAFKYTGVNPVIEIFIEEGEKDLTIRVMDNGIGIQTKEIDKIFNRFYQASNNKDFKTHIGSGIGLSLSKGIIDLHHGSIKVESNPGYGSIFIITLLKGNEHFKPEEIAEPEEMEIEYNLKDMNKTALESPKELTENNLTDDDPEKKYKLLIVEDNAELREILESLFSPYYEVHITGNGKEGFEKAKSLIPDIIISDIMMPVMTGTELCIKIKNDFELCHIPVVLLTALNSAEQSIEGLSRGADDYIGKPFNSRVLLTRCNNLLRNRIILQKKFSQQENFDILQLTNNPIDQKFIDDTNKIIDREIDNPTFEMNALAKELGISRSSLYTKFKSLTGLTPNDYVINYKLSKAIDLLARYPEMQILEIADRLGFGSARYFSRCFKEKFLITPADYRKNRN